MKASWQEPGQCASIPLINSCVSQIIGTIKTRPTLERRKTLGHLRSINRNMIIHFANQSQTCQLLKILTSSLCCIFPSHFLFFSRSLYVAYFLAIFIPFLLHSRSVSLYIGFFLAICIFTLLPCSYSLNSGSDLAHLFYSALYCCLISLHFTDLSLHLSLADPSCILWQFVYFLLALSAKSFCDCKYLLTIACASEDTFGKSTAAKFLLDNSPLLDIYGVPSRLLFATCTSTLGMLDFSTHVLLTSLPLSYLSPYHLFYELYQVSVAACHFSS